MVTKLTVKDLDSPLNWKCLEKKLVCLGIPSIGLALMLKYLIDIDPFTNLHLIIFMLMNVIADTLAVQLFNGINVSLNFPIMVCVLLLFGPESAVWVYVPACIFTHVTRKREVYKAIFNVSQITISVFVASMIVPDSYYPINLKHDWLWVLGVVLIFDVLNFSQVIKIFTCINNSKFFKTFKETWLTEMGSVRPIYYAAGIIMAICYQAQGMLGALIVVAPILGVFFLLKSQQELRDQTSRANTDALTGLANRYALDNWWKQGLPSIIQNNKALSVIMLDIDDFKKVNDIYGHHVGDEVLKAVAEILRECIRRTDCIFRFGGEEFIILLPESSTQGAKLVADRIRININNLRLPYLERNSISVSAGISFLDQRLIAEVADIPDELVRRADKAMYMAKQKGKNQVQVYL